MSNQETPESTDDEKSPLDRAAAEGPLPGADEDDQPGGGVEEHVQDSTEQEANASLLGFRLRT